MSDKPTFQAARIFALTTAVLAWLWPGSARAQDFEVSQSKRPAAQVVSDSLRDGAFLPRSMGTASHPHRSAALAWAGYAADRHRAVLDARAEAVLLPWLTLQAGTATDTEASGLRPSLGARIRLLGEAGSRPGLALGAFYKTEGFTEPEGEVEGVLAISAHVGSVGLLANLVYGQDADGRERDAEAGAAATVAVRDRWLMGIDTRMRMNLVPSSAATPGKPALPRFDLVAGPLAMCRLGPTFVAAQTGIAMIELTDLRVGVFALFGVGAAL